MVPNLSCIVKNASFCSVTTDSFDDFFKTSTFKIRSSNEFIEVRYISIVVLTVMILERLFGDVRLKSVFLERKRRKFKSHSQFP